MQPIWLHTVKGNSYKALEDLMVDLGSFNRGNARLLRPFEAVPLKPSLKKYLAFGRGMVSAVGQVIWTNAVLPPCYSELLSILTNIKF